MFKVSVAIVALVMASGMGRAQQAVANAMRDEIVAAERAKLDTWKRGDGQAFADVTADDAIFVDASGLVSKADLVKALGAGLRLTDYTMSDIRFVQLSADSGLIVYRMADSGTFNGHDFTAKLVNSATWVKRGGRWRWELWQETRQPTAPAASAAATP